MHYDDILPLFVHFFRSDWYDEFMSKNQPDPFKMDRFFLFLKNKITRSPNDEQTINNAIEHIQNGAMKLFFIQSVLNGDNLDLIMARKLRAKGHKVYSQTVAKLGNELNIQLKPFENWVKRDLEGRNWYSVNDAPKDYSIPNTKVIEVQFDGRVQNVHCQENKRAIYFYSEIGTGENFQIFCLLLSYVETAKKWGIEEFDAICRLINRDRIEFLELNHLSDDYLKRNIIVDSMKLEFAKNKLLVTPVLFRKIIMNHSGLDKDTFFAMKKVKSWCALWQRANFMSDGQSFYEMAAGEFIHRHGGEAKRSDNLRKTAEVWKSPNHCNICYRLSGANKCCSLHDYRINRAEYRRGKLIKKKYNVHSIKYCANMPKIPFEAEELRCWLNEYAPTISQKYNQGVNLLELLTLLDDQEDFNEHRKQIHALWSGIERGEVLCLSRGASLFLNPSRGRAQLFVLKADAWEAQEQKLKHGGNNKCNSSVIKKIRSLTEQGKTQVEIATRLGVSQALVSNYLREDCFDVPNQLVGGSVNRLRIDAENSRYIRLCNRRDCKFNCVDISTS